MTYSQVLSELKTCYLDCSAPEFNREASLQLLTYPDEWGIRPCGIQLRHIIWTSTIGFTLSLLFWLVPLFQAENNTVIFLPIFVAAAIVVIEVAAAHRRKKLGWILYQPAGENLKLHHRLAIANSTIRGVVEVTFEQSMRPGETPSNLEINPDFARSALGLFVQSEQGDCSLFVICYVQVGSGFPRMIKLLADKLGKPGYLISAC